MFTRVRIRFMSSLNVCLTFAGIFQGVVNVLAFGGITCVLWYGGKLLYENTHGVSEGITAGILTCTFTLMAVYKYI